MKNNQVILHNVKKKPNFTAQYALIFICLLTNHYFHHEQN